VKWKEEGLSFRIYIPIGEEKRHTTILHHHHHQHHPCTVEKGKKGRKKNVVVFFFILRVKTCVYIRKKVEKKRSNYLQQDAVRAINFFWEKISIWIFHLVLALVRGCSSIEI
jgi:hypothetical protein